MGRRSTDFAKKEPGAGSLKSEARSQKSEARSQKKSCWYGADEIDRCFRGRSALLHEQHRQKSHAEYALRPYAHTFP
jgi:hypothetical protein